MEHGQARSFELAAVFCRIAGRGRHEAYFLIDHELHDVRIADERLRDVHSERFVRELAHLADFIPDRIELTRRRLDDAHAARVRHRRCELSASNPSHRRLNDRVLDAQHLSDSVRETSLHSHRGPPCTSWPQFTLTRYSCDSLRGSHEEE